MARPKKNREFPIREKEIPLPLWVTLAVAEVISNQLTTLDRIVGVAVKRKLSEPVRTVLVVTYKGRLLPFTWIRIRVIIAVQSYSMKIKI